LTNKKEWYWRLKGGYRGVCVVAVDKDISKGCRTLMPQQ
jgi:hypothetical protein